MAISYHPEFLTATILKWKRLLMDDEIKKIIIDCLKWLVQNKRCKVYGFVIMPNHIHLLWKIEDDFERINVQGALFSFTAHEFKKYLKKNNKIELNKYIVTTSDREFQFWERNSMVIECWSEWFFEQKLNYIHNNPMQLHWKLSDLPENYYWSSASYYVESDQMFDFLTHYKE